MKYMQIGRSGIEASQIALGTWAIGGGSWWGQNDDQESIRTIHGAMDKGINLIDTAPVYGFGHSEEIVGKAIKDRRHKVHISTKCGIWWNDNEGSFYFSRDGYNTYKNLSKRAVKQGLEDSLRRLGTDYIDIFFTHWQSVEPFFTPVEETMEALNELKQEGKILAIGASNVSPEHIKAYTACGQLDIIQEKYSILDRRIEAEILPCAESYGITFQAYSPLEQGILTGKIQKDYVPEEGSARFGKKWYEPEYLSQAVDMVASWRGLCEKYNCTPTHLAIAWITAQGQSMNVLCGARKVEQLEDNIGGADILLTQEECDWMRAQASFK
ncbi:aldo/keto reductase [Sporanaerobium hydrogeniformans]|uniref:Aldo/keto reductase n=1 Tax=Sporanaerobium hydrogeniformans TaxID=3072179 RepID=A0AC61DL48_9FIRM|nr:aldo/keto reductase [Sporanaerobium hydrogeniformans]PHV72287.1 aldo/keto reductase [Sporanaerobium hydrogeniformans]